VLVLAAVALLPLWRPLGPAGVPVATLSYAPQGIAADLRTLVSERSSAHPLQVWNPQPWGSWLEFAVPEARYVVDSRVELFPAALWTDAHQVSTGTGEWLSILEGARVSLLVLTPDETRRLGDTLASTGRWAPRYADADGSIWVSTGP
jgi:hypothetical protein